MRLEVLRSAALCWFGNVHLASDDESRLAEVSLKSCFKGVERLELLRPNAHHLSAPGAAFVIGTKTWYRRLKADGIESFRLHLPLSLMEPLVAPYGVVTDSPNGSDIWVCTPKSTQRQVEYAAQRFAAWSMPRPQPSADLITALTARIIELKGECATIGTPMARRVERLALSFAQPGSVAEGFEDCIPTEFGANYRQLAAKAVRTVAILGAEDVVMDTSSPINEHVDGIFKQALRLLESISAETFEESGRMVA